MQEYEFEFYKTFDIEPIYKNGEKVFSPLYPNYTRTIEEDEYPQIDEEKIHALEEIFLETSEHVTLEITRDHNKYQYLFVNHPTESNPDEYHHGFTTGVYNSRQQAIIMLCLEYKHTDYVKQGVKAIFNMDSGWEM